MSSKSHKSVTFIYKLIEDPSIDTFQSFNHKGYVLNSVVWGAASIDFSRDYCKVSTLDFEGFGVVNLDLLDMFNLLKILFKVSCLHLMRHKLLQNLLLWIKLILKQNQLPSINSTHIHSLLRWCLLLVLWVWLVLLRNRYERITHRWRFPILLVQICRLLLRRGGRSSQPLSKVAHLSNSIRVNVVLTQTDLWLRLWMTK